MVKVDALRPSSVASPFRLGLLRSGWIPAVLVLVFALATLRLFGVPLSQAMLFALYVALCITLPGTLWWRALVGGRRGMAESLAAGTALGYALEVLAYIPARAAGMPLLFLLCPFATIALFAAVPALRRRVRGRDRQGRSPAWWNWVMAVMVAFTIGIAGAVNFRAYGLTWPENSGVYVDLPWHLSLAAEIKNHFPPMIPYLSGEALNYHWFVYADMAATSWATGLELQTLLFRLSVLPMIVAVTVLVAIAARRVSGRWWSGPAALAILFVGAAPNPYVRSGEWVPTGGGVTLGWLSPTHALAAMLFVPLVMVLIDLMRRPEGHRGRWGLVAVLLVALTGAKATFLPLLLGGLVLLLIAHFVVMRRIHRVAAVAAVLSAACLVLAQLVLYRGDGQGLRVAPLHLLEFAEYALKPSLRLISPLGEDTFPGTVVLALAIYLAGWACVWGAAAGLLRDRRRLLDPAVSLLAGIGASGLGAALVFGHPGMSELYFLRAASPYLAILAVYGLSVVLPPRRPWLVVAGAAGAGIAATAVSQLWILTVRPVSQVYPLARLLPYLPFVAALVLAVLVLRLVQRRHLIWVVVPVMALTFCAHAVRAQVSGPFERMAREDSLHIGKTGKRSKEMPKRGLQAARWLRDHSGVDDLIATNTHCRRVVRAPRSCDNRHFWLSGYSERRVLLEGWGYADGVDSRTDLYSPPSATRVAYSNPALMIENDAAFVSPSAQSVAALRDRHGVRWLFLDARYPGNREELSRFARPRFSAGRFSVYEIVTP